MALDAKASAAIAAFVALWMSAEDKVGSVDLTALTAHPRKGWDEATRDSADDAFDAKKFRKSTLAGLLANTIDAVIAAPPDAMHGPDCYLVTGLKAALGARYEDGWVQRIEAYATASGWTGVALEDPAALAPAAPATAPAAPAAGPAAASAGAPAAVRPLPGLGAPPSGGPAVAQSRPLPGQALSAPAPAQVVVPPAPRLQVRQDLVRAQFARPAVQRFFATLTAAFGRGDMEAVNRGRANLDLDVNRRLLGEDAVSTLVMYIDIRRGTIHGITMTPVEIHLAFGLNPP
jgi:hypothetical protein